MCCMAMMNFDIWGEVDAIVLSDEVLQALRNMRVTFVRVDCVEKML